MTCRPLGAVPREPKQSRQYLSISVTCCRPSNCEEHILNTNQYTAATNAEVVFKNIIGEGAKGMAARRVQEWLGHHGLRTGIDGNFGPATATVVRKFQSHTGLPPTGKVDEATWEALVRPMHEALQDGGGTTLKERVASIAARHLAIRPIELGGNNRGPWVRMYTGGFEGTEWAWCAGFVSAILRQASLELQRPMPIKGSLSCDTLAAQAQSAKLFVSEKQIGNGISDWSALGTAYIFLARRTPGDWTHTGFGFGGAPLSFDTIEGNSNNEGSRDGYEVCNLTRSAAKKDFIVLP